MILIGRDKGTKIFIGWNRSGSIGLNPLGIKNWHRTDHAYKTLYYILAVRSCLARWLPSNR